MASFLKMFIRPCLQLLVLMLVLGAGLLPKNSMVEAVNCWVQKNCDGSIKCLGPAAEPAATKTDCPEGYCSYQIRNVENERFILVNRGCATAKQIACPKGESGHCVKLTMTGNKEIDSETIDKSEAFTCLLTSKARSAEAEEKGTGPGNAEACLCDTDLCNGKGFEWNRTREIPSPTSTESTGVKHLGCNVALVGALLVAVLPLQTMSSVG